MEQLLDQAIAAPCRLREKWRGGSSEDGTPCPAGEVDDLSSAKEALQRSDQVAVARWIMIAGVDGEMSLSSMIGNHRCNCSCGVINSDGVPVVLAGSDDWNTRPLCQFE